MRLADYAVRGRVVELRSQHDQTAFFTQLLRQYPGTTPPTTSLIDRDGYHIGVIFGIRGTSAQWSWHNISYFRDSPSVYTIFPFTSYIYRRPHDSIQTS